VGARRRPRSGGLDAGDLLAVGEAWERGPGPGSMAEIPQLSSSWVSRARSLSGMVRLITVVGLSVATLPPSDTNICLPLRHAQGRTIVVLLLAEMCPAESPTTPEVGSDA
jgi:hypothetical protein